jgi:hypothetical protein
MQDAVYRKLRNKQQPPADLPPFECFVRSRSLREWKRAINPDGNFALLEPVDEPLNIMRILFYVGAAVGAGEK